jgi:hypothetical protein
MSFSTRDQTERNQRATKVILLVGLDAVEKKLGDPKTGKAGRKTGPPFGYYVKLWITG